MLYYINIRVNELYITNKKIKNIQYNKSYLIYYQVGIPVTPYMQAVGTKHLLRYRL